MKGGETLRQKKCPTQKMKIFYWLMLAGFIQQSAKEKTTRTYREKRLFCQKGGYNTVK